MTIVYTKDRDWYLLGSKVQVKAIDSPTQLDVLNSSVKQSIPRDWLPAVFMAEEELLPIISVDNERSFDFSNQDINGWLSLIKNELYSHPSVEDIFVGIEDSDVDVWVVIPERDLATLHQIVEMEGELFDILVSGESPPFLMDFHIIYRHGRNIEDLAPTKAIRLPRQV